MAPGWEAVRTRESFEIETGPPARRRGPTSFPSKRFTVTTGIVLILTILIFSSLHAHKKDVLPHAQSTSADPTTTDIPSSKAGAPPVLSSGLADVEVTPVISSTDDKPVQPSLASSLQTPSSVADYEPAESTTIPQGVQTSAPPPPNPISQLSTTKAAVIIETRSLPNLIPIILHFSSILGPEWAIHIFTDGSNSELFVQSPAFQRGIRDGRFRVRSLLAGTNVTTQTALSEFFTKSWLWEEMAPAEHVLIFQTDSIICANSPQKVEYFFEYDFVGAPINSERKLGVGYNGGLSLRNRTLSLEITKSFDWQTDRNEGNSGANLNHEDQWFSQKMKAMGANLPTTEVASEFSVETMWYDKPLGYHLPNVWQKKRMGEIEKWCPEIKICTTEAFAET